MNLMAGSRGYSISAAQGDIAPEHDRREYEPGNVDARLSANNNIIIDTPDERKAFNELFADSIEAYNAGQKRNDRKKSFDYLSEIENGKGAEKPFYEYVFQIGNRDTNGVTTSSFDEEAWKKDKKGYDIMSCVNNDADRLKLKEILDSEMASLQKRYPAFHFWSVIGHDDEPNGTYHYHVRFTPVGSGYKNGMDRRCSLTKALNSMGFYTNGGDLAVMQWQNDVKDHISEAMENEGYYREFMSNEEEHASVSTFKLKKEKEKLVAEAEKAVEDAKAKIAEEHETAINKMLDEMIEMDTELQIDRYLENQELIEEFGQIQLERHEMELEMHEAYEQLKAELEAARKEAHEQLNAELEAKRKKAESELNANIGPRIRAVYNREQAAKTKEEDLDQRAVEIIMYEDYINTLTDDFNALSDEQKKTVRARNAKEKLDKTQAYIKAEKERQIRKAAETAEDAEEWKRRSDKEYSI